MTNSAVYPCNNHSFAGFPGLEDSAWNQAREAMMVDTQTGKRPFLLTGFRMIRDDQQQALFIRFEAQDDQVVSTFRWDDEPLYRQDVLELFITDQDAAAGYLELEASPFDLRFAGRISYDGPENRKLQMGLDLPGFLTKTRFDAGLHQLLSIWRLPYSAFGASAGSGKSFPCNLFRVDHSKRGISLQAWQATHEPNFHVPAAFGRIQFL